MPRRCANDKPFEELTWDDLNEWAGSRIVSRGKNYQRKGRVSGLATTDGGGESAGDDVALAGAHRCD